MIRYIILFSLVALAQLFVPASMIVRREITLRSGEVYRFRTAPVDPYDAFRGRYVALSYADNSVPLSEISEKWERNVRVYILLEEDQEGFAVPVGISKERPSDRGYIQGRVWYVNHTDKKVFLEYPLDRYYMNENDAPEAEAALRRLRTGENRDVIRAHVEVRIKKGFPVISDLYLDGIPALEYLKVQRTDDGNGT